MGVENVNKKQRKELKKLFSNLKLMTVMTIVIGLAIIVFIMIIKGLLDSFCYLFGCP